MELDLCLLQITVIISIAVITAAPVEINHHVVKRSVCKDFICPPGYECCEDIDLCGGANCQPCIDGTFSSGREICQNCSNCLQGEKMIEVCTRTSDTICECPAGNYITSYRVCKPCSTCSEGEDCGKCQLTITIRSTLITAKTAVPASETSIAKHGSPCQCNCKQDTMVPWYYLLLTAVCSPVIVHAILKWGKKIVCWWTRDSKQYYADNCSCCPSCCCFRGGQKVNQPNSGPNGPNDPNGRNDSEANETIELDEMNEQYERNEQNETIQPNERNEPNETIEPNERNEQNEIIEPNERNEPNETIEPNERNEQNEIIEPSESGGGEEEQPTKC
ncbi:uncharacterized protein [Antedon mediterranea]|uniref:uncharacterized protein n=1 Tax=Antedon mediterranea TaxID=105859 RepID=UPI003AF9A205